MTYRLRTRRRPDRAQRGQALAEMGVVVFLFVLLTLGIIEFGRLLMIVNVITHAARDGARAAAVVSIPNRGGGGGCGFSGTPLTDIQSRVNAQIANVTAQSFTVTVTPQCVNSIPVIAVGISGSIDLLYNIIGSGMNIDRSVAFRDENCPTC